MGRPHLQLLAAERLQSAWLAQVHGDAVVGRASHSIGTSECRIPCAGCWMGRSCSQSGFARQGGGSGCFRPPAIRSERKEAEEWPTHARLLLVGRREGWAGAASLSCPGPRGAPRLSGGQPPAPCQQRCHHKVLSPSPQGAAGPGMGKKEAAGVHPGLPLCTGAVRASSTLYKPWNGCVGIRSLFLEIGSCSRGGSSCRQPGAQLVPGMSQIPAQG